jgi:hypothetical protein
VLINESGNFSVNIHSFPYYNSLIGTQIVFQKKIKIGTQIKRSLASKMLEKKKTSIKDVGRSEGGYKRKLRLCLDEIFKNF